MKKELLKGFTMVVLILVLALVSAVASAKAQSANKVAADVPFEFSVGYKTMPAGAYQVEVLTSAGDALMIQSADRGRSAVRLSEATEKAKNKPHARLVFHRYGQQYFLAEVWNGMDNSGRQLKTSQDELTLQKQLAAIPANDPKTAYETIEVLASLR
ncbi:MAG: hypothetical protein QOD33_577 [Pyrinomonadaceae bacterium]|jgi:hypothetical protein|nr:hypothetical protein [Pyrinomonadaceae bacterium]